MFREGVSLKVTRSKEVAEAHRLDKWEKLSDLSHPLTGLIIFDKHVLNILPVEIEVNVIPLISNLIGGTYKDRIITVTIISEPKQGFLLKQYVDEIEKKLLELKLVNIKINIIRHNKAFYPQDFEGLHARILISNFLHIVSDACLNFFKKGKVVNVANVTATLSLSSFSNQSYQKDVNDLRKYISKLVNSQSRDVNYNDVFYPDKLNPLLN